jgi:hypothetical protein
LPSSTNLDAETIGLQLVRDVDVPLALLAVRVAHGVRHRLGKRELEVGHRVVADVAELREPRQREPAERDVFGLRRNPQPNLAHAVGLRGLAILRQISHRTHDAPAA